MEFPHTFSRRHFLKGLTAAVSLAHASGRCNACAGDIPDATSREKLSQFLYSDVHLTGGPLKDQFDRIHAAYLRINEDNLLKEMRVRAGLPAPGEYLGGWYDGDGFAPGHCFGQYISGLARFAAATGDAPTAAKARRLVDGFAAAIGPDGFCYPSQKAAHNFPAYNYDKYVIGLLDAYRFAGASDALEILDRITKGCLPYMPPRARDRLVEHPERAPDDESYTLGENQFYAYEVTGKKEYFELAKKYLLNQTYFEPLSRDQNVLPGRHAYSHCNALSSAARAYQDLGDPMYLAAIQNAWEMLERTQQFASGGWGPNETFVEPGKGLLGESLEKTHAHFETPCGSYAHFKLARYLLRFTADARYGDGLERVLYNTILGAKDPSGDGHFFYYSDYHPSTTKGYFPDKYPCCSGTLPQVVADYLVSAYFQSSDGIYVNLFTPSTVNWKIHGAPARLIQSTNYPESDSTELRLELYSPAEFTVFVRIPGWLEKPAQILVNGKSASVAAEPRTFAPLRRRWENNDVIQLTLPFSLRTERVDDQHPNTAALMHGPLMLVALGQPPTLEKAIIHRAQTPKIVTNANGVLELPALPETKSFVPFYRIGEESYTTYLHLV